MAFTTHGSDSAFRGVSAPVRMRSSLICIVEGDGGASRRALSHFERGDVRVRIASVRTYDLARLQQLNPSLILIETNPSDNRGLEFCQAIRRLPELSDTPIILIAEDGSDEDRALGLEAGAD